MDIVIVAQYLGNLEHLETSNGRFVYLGSMLSERNEVEIITTTFPHAQKCQAKHIPDYFKGCKITALYEPGYPKNVCLKRFASHYRLAKNIKKYLNQRKKPDIIYAAVPSLSVAAEAAKYCRKNNVRFIVDVQDLWPEAFKMVFHVPLLSSAVFYPMRRQADLIYAMADKIIAVSQTYADRALRVNKKCQEASVVYLGTDKHVFDEYAKVNMPFNVRDKIIREEMAASSGKMNMDKPNRDTKYQEIVNSIFGKIPGKDITRLVYVGTLGHSYDISVVLAALREFSDDEIKEVQFVVIGDGPKRKQFEQEAAGLPVIFTGLIAYTEVVWLLCRCDIAINPIKKGAAQSIINKHMDYAMAGLPVINTQECIEYRNLLEKYKCGINCQCENKNSVAKAIRYLMKNEHMQKKMGKKHRRMAEELFDRGQSYLKIFDIIEK